MTKPSRRELKKCLGKQVEIVLFDNTIHIGTLHKTNEEEFKNDPNICIAKNRYFCIGEETSIKTLFRVSHIRFLNVVDSDMDKIKK